MVTVPQIIYVSAVAVYGVFFLFFARFFWWKYLADRDFWHRRPNLTISQVKALAKDKHRDLPRFTILVPARNEAEVIGKTVEHMSHLDYPSSHYEVMVATDEKEIIEARRTRPAAVSEVLKVICRDPGRQEIGPACEAPAPQGQAQPATHNQPLSADAERLLLHLVAAQALREYSSSNGRRSGLVVPSGLAWLPRRKRLELIRDLSRQLIEGRGRMSFSKLACTIERLAPGRPGEYLLKQSGALLGLAIPVVAAYADLAGATQPRLMQAMLRQVARAQHRVTEEIISSMARVIAGRLVRSIDRDAEDEATLRARLEAAAVEALPTTQDILDDWIAANGGRAGGVVVRHVVVPYDFDGAYHGQRTGAAVPSTKGRALNYALAFVSPETEMCGFYDAESRPDQRTLLYVAMRRIQAPREATLFQGPVFQVRNLFNMGPWCKIAALYQAVSHEWYLPQLFHRLPFVGGTNLYVERTLICSLGGYDSDILTEDLELGIRAYVQAGVWPEYLPYASSEQTPPTLRGFFRQRLRWGTGHLQVMDKLRAEHDWDGQRRRQMLHHLFVKGQLEWCLYQTATMVPPIVLVLHAMGLIDPSVFPRPVHLALNLFTLVYFGFTFYVYVRYRPFIDMTARPRNWLGDWSVVPQLVLLPFAAFMFPVPYSTAMVLKGLGREPRMWVKTPRTAE